MREVAALLLAGVLLVAGGAKLFDVAGTRRSVAELGLPRFLGWPAAIAVPPLELALAAGLLVEATSRAAAGVAAGLFGAFAAVLAVAALRGRQASCGCFGRLHEARAGYRAAARSGVLALVAASVAVTPAGELDWRELAIGLAVAGALVQGVLWIVLLRRYGRSLRRIDELTSAGEGEPDPVLRPGDAMPPFVLPHVDGGRRSLGDLLAPGLPALLVLTDERCPSCATLYPDLGRWQAEHGDRVTIAVLGLGSAEALTALAEEHDLATVLVADHDTFASLGVEATPAALVVEPDGRVAQTLRYGAIDVEMLLLDIVEAHMTKEVALHG